MSIVEQVKNLSIEIKDVKSYKELEDSLKKYHEMVQSGQLKPRESQVQNIYVTFEYRSNYSYRICRTSGMIEDLADNGEHLITRPIVPQIWRTPIDNDCSICLQWQDAGFDKASIECYSCELTAAEDEKAVIRAKISMGAAPKEPLCYADVTYTVRTGLGLKIDFDVKWRRILCHNPEDPSKREKLYRPRFGVRLTMPEGSEYMRYFGYGPYESYLDKRMASKLGEYSSKVTDNFEPYIFPQENSSHWGCRWADVHTAAGHGFLFTSPAPFSFSASHFSPEQLTQKAHHYELKREPETTVILDCRQSGIGSASCGPMLDEDLRFDEDRTVCSVILLPVFSAEIDPYKESRTIWR